MFKALNAGASDLIMPDLGRIGGVTGWQRAAAIAAVQGVPMSNHLYIPFSATMLRVSESADWLEYSDWASPILKNKFEASDGFVTVLDVPGSGVEWDEESVAKFTVPITQSSL